MLFLLPRTVRCAIIDPSHVSPRQPQSESDFLTGRLLIEDDEAPNADSIDKLLALTQDRWTVEEQIASLKRASQDTGVPRAAEASRPHLSKVPSVIQPVPAELGALRVGVTSGSVSVLPPLPPSATSPAAPAVSTASTSPGLPLVDTPSPTAGTAASASRPPPPLPPQASAANAANAQRPSKGPPPLPPQAGSRPSRAPSMPSMPPQPLPTIAQSSPPTRRADAGPPAFSPGPLLDLLAAREGKLEGTDDRVALSRVNLELATANELVGDETRAATHAELVLKIDPSSAPAHSLLRRRKYGRTSLATMVGHLDKEILAAHDPAKVDLLAERARLLEAMGAERTDVQSAWELALARSPDHPAALKGLEAELATRATASTTSSADPSERMKAHEALATHLAKMADAYAKEPRLAAWLHVERAEILERQVRQPDAARRALVRAVELDASVGPVRDAYVRHIAAHGDFAALADALEEEATLETDAARASQLDFEAAILASTRLGETDRAILLLERALARGGRSHVEIRTLDKLVHLYEAELRFQDVARVRRIRLARIDAEPEGRTKAQALAVETERRTLARIEERLGRLDPAIEDARQARELCPNDQGLLELLDRLFAARERHDERLALWTDEAARTTDDDARAKALVIAADVAERSLGLPQEATRILRSAWSSLPGHAELFEALARRVYPTVPAQTIAEGRALADVYAKGAASTTDRVRKVALLERVALLYEELLGDDTAATRAYEEVLTLEPGRRSAILGLARTAARLGDDRALAKALIEESKHAESEADVLSLQVKAATALLNVDAARALRLVEDMLARAPHHAPARALEQRLHEAAKRWELAALSLRARIDLSNADEERIQLWLALAELQDLHLRSPAQAMASLQAVREIAPNHPVPPEKLAGLLEATGDWAMFGDALEKLAATASSDEERARWLAQAGEVAELQARDDGRAAQLYKRALELTPDDDLIADRVARVLSRRAVDKQSEAGEATEKSTRMRDSYDRSAEASRRLALANEKNDRAGRVRFAFELASLRVESGLDLTQATGMLEEVLLEAPAHIPALRLLESIARRTQAWVPLARTLSRQGERFVDPRARIGSLWSLAALEEWRLSAPLAPLAPFAPAKETSSASSPPTSLEASTYGRILEIDGTDASALDAVQRREIPGARKGDPRARHTLATALNMLVTRATDEASKTSLLLRLALLLETVLNDASEQHAPQLARQALERYRTALSLDSLSVTAATGLARLSTRLGDAAGALAAASTLAELAAIPRTRARYLLEAADILLGPSEDERLGPIDDRRNRAGAMLETALDVDADSIPVAARLASFRLEGIEPGHSPARLVEAFKAASLRSKNVDAIIMLSTEIARVARDELGDLVSATEAMRRVRGVAPDHVASLLTLAELSIATRSWPDAVDALEAVVACARDASPKLTALFALASVYDKILDRPDDAELALRKALALDPRNARGLRALVHRLVSSGGGGAGDSDFAPRAQRVEVAELLDRLADVETDPQKKSQVLVELAETRLHLEQPAEAERALIEAVVCAPGYPRAAIRLRQLYKGRAAGGAFDGPAYSRALQSVISRAQRLSTVDPRWIAELGQLEIDLLNKPREGVAHLQQAVQMDNALYDTRFALAAAMAKLNAHEEALKTMLAMVIPSPRPLLELTNPAAGLELLDREFAAERRPDEAAVVSELRVVAGDLDEGRSEWLRNRRLQPWDQHLVPLDRHVLVSHAVPSKGRHVLLEVAAAIAGLESKILRNDLTDLGMSPKDRVSPRTGHPTRLLLDRLAKAAGVETVELVITTALTRTRVLVQDEPWIAVPRALTELPEPAQAASLARAVVRIALAVPWLEELPALHVEALLVAVARQVVPTYGANEIDVLQSKLVAQYEPSVAKNLTRKQKRTLEEIAPLLTKRDAAPPAVDTFLGALARGELRAAFLLTGNLLALFEELRRFDVDLARATDRPGPSALSAIMDHPYAGDLARYAMSAEATALRRRTGAIF